MIVKAILLLAVGVVLTLLGARAWRLRRTESVSLIEASILKLGNAEPLPRNKWDRVMAYVQPVLLMIFGPIMVFLALIILFA